VALCRAPLYPLPQQSRHWQSCHTHIRIHTTLFRMFFHTSRFMPLHFPLLKTNCMYKQVQAHTRSINIHHNRCRVLAPMVSRSKITDMASGVEVEQQDTECRLRARSAFRENVNGNGVARWSGSPTPGGHAVVPTAGITNAVGMRGAGDAA